MRNLILLVCVCALATLGVPSLTSAEPLFDEQNVENGATAPPARQSQQKTPESNAQAVVLSRFSFQRVKDELLRLDRESGEIALCSSRGGRFTCEVAPESRAVSEKECKTGLEKENKERKLENENAQLRSEVTRLTAELSERRSATSPPSPPPAALNPPANDGGLKPRIDDTIGRLRLAIENAWRRAMNMLADFRRDIMHKVQRDRTAI